MKIRPEHYAKMKDAIAELCRKNPLLTPGYYASNGIGKDTAMRHRWDFLNRSTIDGRPSSAWICAELYPYMSDTHIDTALRSIQAELWPVAKDAILRGDIDKLREIAHDAAVFGVTREVMYWLDRIW